MSIHKLHLPERPFRAIKKGTKKVEARAEDVSQMKSGDILVFEHETTGELLETTILFVNHYLDSKTLLETEGVENVLSSEPKTIEHGIESLNSFTGYKERIEKYGIYAIGVKINSV